MQRDAKTHFKLGEKYYSEGNWMNAIHHFDTCISIQPLHFNAFYSRAIARERTGDLHGAIADYGSMIHIDPEFTEAYWNRALLYYEVQFYELSNNDLYALLQLPEDETNAVYFKTTYPDAGITGIATLETMKAQIFNQLGLVAYSMEEFQLAVAHFTRSLEFDSQNADYLVNRSLSYEAMEQYTFATNDLNLAGKLDPENTLVAYNIARIQESTGSTNDLISTYTVIIKNAPEFAEAYAKRGIAKMQIGDLNGALADYDSAIYFSPDDALLWLNRGIIRLKLKEYHKAYSDLNKSLDLNPILEEAYFNRGNTLMKMDQHTKAIDDYNIAIMYYPSFGMAYYNRGIAYHRTDQLIKACEDVEKAIKMGIKQAKVTYEKMCR